MKKKILSIVLVLSLLMSLISAESIVVVNAATDISSAKSISVNSSYTGNIESGSYSEKDYYKFTISQNGYVTINFANSSPSSSTSEAWRITLLTNYAAETITSSVAKLNNSSISLTTIGLSAGTYYICVESTSLYSVISTNNYTIKAAFTSASNWEKEFNEDVSTSNIIDVNETYYGTIRNGSYSGRDYYKFETADDGYVTVDFTNSTPTSNSNDAWKIILYGFDSDGLTEIVSKVATTSNSKVSMTTVGLPAGTYYICVLSNSQYSVVSDCKYGIYVNFTAADDWEKEFNEDVSTSNIIDVNETYYGTIRNGSYSGRDYYKFETADDGYVTVDFTNTSPTTSSSDAWKVTLYGFNSSELTDITSKVISTSNSKASLTTVGLPKGTYYICIQSASQYSVASTNKYSFIVNYTPSDTWEKEFNEDSTTATHIVSQEKYTGTIRNGYAYAKDYYKFTTTSSGSINITFYNDTSSTSSDNAWRMYVYDSNLNQLDLKTIKKNDTSVSVSLTGKLAGTYYICVQSASQYSVATNTPYKLKVVGAGIPISMDSTMPTGSISSTNNAATSQTVTLKLSDNAGVAGYYWGTSSTYSNNTYTSTSASSVTKTISSAGTYYLVVKDTSGNVSNPYSITFYKTTLNANGGSVSPSYVITKSGTSVTLPTPTRTGCSFVGWGTSSTSTSGVKSISPTSSETYYAIWNPIISVMGLNSTNNATISTGGEMKYFTYTPTTSGSYVIYSTGSDDTRVYLYNASGTELDSDDDDGDGNNFRLEYNLTAGTTYKFGIKYYNSSKTGTISFKFGNVYTISYNANGGSGAPSSQRKDYGTDITLSTSEPTKNGDEFLGWATSNNASTATYQPGDKFSLNNNTTLYAVWKSNESAVDKGDINGDGVVDAGDAVLISRYDAGLISLTSAQLAIGDVNNDGYVDAGDAVVISRYDAGIIDYIG